MSASLDEVRGRVVTAGVRRHADVAVGMASAILVFVAVPGALSLAVGVPLVGPAGRLGTLVPRLAVDVLGILGWTAWVSASWPLARSVLRQVLGREMIGPLRPRLTDRVAARIATAILIVLPLSVALPSVAGGSTTSPGRAPQPSTPAAVVVTRLVGPTPEPAGPVVTPSPTTYLVEPGDSLWSIAQALYGDAAEWQSIASLNLGRPMSGGTRFLDPALIRPGWVLRLPPGAALEPSPPTDLGPRVPAVADSMTGIAGVAARLPAPGRSPGAGSSTGAPPTAERPPGPAARDLASPRRLTRPGTPRPDRPWGPTLPELAALGIGALGAAAFARRLRLRRPSPWVDRPDPRGDPDVMDDDPDGVVDLATLCGHFDGAPVLDWLDLANRSLSATTTAPSGLPVPPVLIFRIGVDGVDAWLGETATWAPHPWALAGGGRLWHLSSRLDPGTLRARTRGAEPRYPAVVPVGDDETGTWLAVVGAGSCLPVIGDGADALVATMRLTAESWPWADHLAVTDDAGSAECVASAPASSSGDGRLAPRPVLFVGDPSLLTPNARAQCATVTTLPLPATDLTIAVDRRAVSIHPLGVTLRPHALDHGRIAPARRLFDPARHEGLPAAWPEVARPVSAPPAPPAPRSSAVDSSAVDSSAVDSSAVDSSAVDSSAVDSSAVDSSAVDSSAVDSSAVDSSAVDSSAVARRPASSPPAPLSWASPRGADAPLGLGPGPVEVRLLVPVPRIDGLRHELTAKRVRRATELVAYLALHHPDPVTSDRLRTRVLGSPDADAAAKTLFNVATAARKALGFGPEAEPYLPAALKTGHYRISELVTVDVTRAATFVVAAREAPDDAEAIALYRAALELVEGEPVSAILSGYAWWQSEGHAERARAMLVEAACGIARLAAASGPGGLVDWALRQARAVDPFSEELTQVAMRWAAESGDADRLRREWIECRRMVDDLDPGGVPSARTEALYVELTRRTAARSGAPARRSPDPRAAQASLAAMEAAPRRTEPSAP